MHFLSSLFLHGSFLRRFPTRYWYGDDYIKDSIVEFAEKKLLYRKTAGTPLYDAEKLACLTVRLGLDFRATSWTEREREREQVERHMRLCLAATPGFHNMVTISPSEPLLAEAAHRAMANQTVDMAQALLEHIDSSYLKAGDRGGRRSSPSFARSGHCHR